MESDNLELILLARTSNRYELDYIVSVLEENNIPYILKDKGAGGYMKIIGLQTYGTDILVEKSTYERAQELVGGV